MLLSIVVHSFIMFLNTEIQEQLQKNNLLVLDFISYQYFFINVCHIFSIVSHHSILYRQEITFLEKFSTIPKMTMHFKHLFNR